ncbi:MAG TPA: NAD(P)/FAD-dependent oxidoreductase [Silvibacterium sp.]|nr:NAD(P)/FAD-dependent oxidoreductase [Silvibacterium sp.]
MKEEANRHFDVIVLGAGAAGLMCAIEAGRRGRRVAILERAERPGKKILISGGGRCNFTNLHCRPENFLSENPHFAKSALARYTPADFLALVEKHRIPWHEKKLGQLFCDRASSDILEMLLTEAAQAGVALFCGAEIVEVRRGDGFYLRAESGEFLAPTLVVATGGLSIPKMGATGFGYEIARQFDVKIVEPRPALVPFVLAAADQQRLCDLSGISTGVVAAIGRQRFAENLLITHRGFSGPAILQISSYWKDGEAVLLDMAPGKRLAAILDSSAARRELSPLRTHLRTILPQRLADRMLELEPPSGWSTHALEAWEERLHHWRITPETTEGFAKAEVTAGGVDTAELSARTMESRVRGLFFIGEVVDVTGHLGGFNFQWAWASGAAAGRAV